MIRGELVIGLDCSTHGAKAIAWSLDGESVAEARCGFDLLCPQPGYYEQRSDDWLAACVDVLRQLGAACGDRVAALGITHQRETFVGIDLDGEPVRNAIVWMDERARREVEVLRAAIGEDAFHRITGKPLSMTPSVVKLLWLREYEVDAFQRAVRWRDVQAQLLAGLTGQDVTSIGSAEPMGLVDLAAGTWSAPILTYLGLTADLLPQLVPCGTIVGPLLADLAHDLCLPAQLPVVATAGDGQVAAVAAQIFSLSSAYMNLGTAIVAGTTSAHYVVNRAFRTMSGAIPNTFLLESDLKGGTFTIDWLCDRLLRRHVPLQELEAEAAKLPAGSDGLMIVPYFATVMDPYWDDDATGIMVGLRGHHGPGHVYRAILEGIALEERLHLSEMEHAAGCAIAKIHVLGGGASSRLWCQILADVLDRPVHPTRSNEATSLGAAIIAATSVGFYPSIEAAAEHMSGLSQQVFRPGPDAIKYARLFDKVYLKLYPALRSALGRLASFTRES